MAGGIPRASSVLTTSVAFVSSGQVPPTAIKADEDNSACRKSNEYCFHSRAVFDDARSEAVVYDRLILPHFQNRTFVPFLQVADVDCVAITRSSVRSCVHARGLKGRKFANGIIGFGDGDFGFRARAEKE